MTITKTQITYKDPKDSIKDKGKKPSTAEPISRLKINIVEARVDNMKTIAGQTVVNKQSHLPVKLFDPYVTVDFPGEDQVRTPSKLDLINAAKSMKKKDLKKNLYVNMEKAGPIEDTKEEEELRRGVVKRALNMKPKTVLLSKDHLGWAFHH